MSPLYDYKCECGEEALLIRYDFDVEPCKRCGATMTRLPSTPALIRIKGQGYPSRKKWMDNWTPESPPFPTVSVHGEKV